ncbi:unnamed protein product [Phytomonas sp. EM1]|nr:unnamed protein product [Phytomonas sp. EM1]|eukprot:CCW62514.1 unnamed protein product [Phytomonas sp. isolate EM1]
MFRSLIRRSNVAKPPTRGLEFLQNRFTNKGTAFSLKERKALGLEGVLPPAVETLDTQVKRCWHQFKLLNQPINRYQLLRGILDKNATLYYAVLMHNLSETLPVVYTPTVGEVCQRYGELYQNDHALYLDLKSKGNVSGLVKNLGMKDVDIIVVTDGSRILGLGDLGCNGVGISIGKSSLYVAGAGLQPSRVLPVVLDVGTNTDKIRENPFYFASRQKRCGDAEFYGLMDEFMEAVTKQWPGAVVQFEDFSNNHCFNILSRYQEKYRCFNDDIQGTGAVIAAGFLNAVKLSKMSPKDHRIIFVGAGSAATGVAQSMADLAALKYGGNAEDYKGNFYFIDSKGLVTNTRGDKLDAHKVSWARKDISAEDNQKLKTLDDVVKRVKPTALIGLGGVPSVFTEGIIKFMTTYCERPIVFPLSNPTSQAEVTPDEAYRWTNGKAIIASGSPFPETVLDGKTLKPSQGNNLYVFPGIGLGCCIAAPSHIPQGTLVAAASALSDLVTPEELEKGLLYPSIDEVREVSAHVAVACIQHLQSVGLAKAGLPTEKDALLKHVLDAMWVPEYLPEEYYLS